MTPVIVEWIGDVAVVTDVDDLPTDLPPHPLLRCAFERLNHRWRMGRFARGDREVTARCLRALDYMAGHLTWANDLDAEPGEGLRRWAWWHGADHPLPDDVPGRARFLDDLRTTAVRGGRWPMPRDYDERK